MRRCCFVGVAAIGIAALGACEAGSGESDSVGDDSLINAPRDNVHTFSVGICRGDLQLKDGVETCTGPEATSCTGTLIAPNLVLTARHCVAGSPTVKNEKDLCLDEVSNTFAGVVSSPIDKLHVTTSSSVRVGSPKWYAPSRIATPTTVNACADDIAVIELGSSIPKSEAVPVAADIFTDIAVRNPRKLTIVGRGAVKFEIDPDAGAPSAFDRGDYQRRILENVPVLCVSNEEKRCSIEDGGNRFFISKDAFKFGSSTLPGDSGSGLFDKARFDQKTPTLVGVFIYGGLDKSGHPTTGAMGVRLTRHREFIVAAAKAAATTGHYAVPAWVAPTPTGADESAP